MYTYNNLKKKNDITNKLSTFNLAGAPVIVTVVVKAGSAVTRLLCDAKAKRAVRTISLDVPPCHPRVLWTGTRTGPGDAHAGLGTSRVPGISTLPVLTTRSTCLLLSLHHFIVPSPSTQTLLYLI